jgi:uncharacterized Fe-S cluster-containing radical SAM superfamily protein
MYDPVSKAEETAKIVCRGNRRKYYRFRPARFYGGIATSDCVGCNLRCVFCWSWQNVVKPEAAGSFHSPDDVAGKLVKIARKKRFSQVRISGNEPTIARDHLLRVLELIPPHVRFILETNGILIGSDSTYADDLARFENLYVRVSLKGTNEEEFSMLTGAEPVGFEFQIKALEHLNRAGVQAHPAVMVSFSPPENVQALQKRLGKINPGFKHIEMEEVMFYGDVDDRLRKVFSQFKGNGPIIRL